MDASADASSPRKAGHRSARSNNKIVGLGVSVDARRGKVYKVRVYHKGKCLNLGRFSDLLQAQLSYDQAVWAMSCQGAKKAIKTNFPIGSYPLDDAEVHRKVQDFMAGLAAAATAADNAAEGNSGGPTQLQLPNVPSPSSSSADTADEDATPPAAPAAAAAGDATNWAMCSGVIGATGNAAAMAGRDEDAAFEQLLQLIPRDSLQHCGSELHRFLLQQEQLGAAVAAAAGTDQQQAQPSFLGLLGIGAEDEAQPAGGEFGPFHDAARRSKSASCEALPSHSGLALPACDWAGPGRAVSCSALGPPNFFRSVAGVGASSGGTCHLPDAHGIAGCMPPPAAPAPEACQDMTSLGAWLPEQQPLLALQPSIVQQETKKRRLGERDVSQDSQQQHQTTESNHHQQQEEEEDLEFTLSNELLGLGLTHSLGSLMLTHSLELLMNGNEQHTMPQQQETEAVAVPAVNAKESTSDAAVKATQGSASSTNQQPASPQPAAADDHAPAMPAGPAVAALGAVARDVALQLIGETVRGLLEMNVALLRGTQTCALRDALMWLSSYRQKRASGGSSSPVDRAALQLMGQVVQLLAQESSAADSGSGGSQGLAAFVERPTALSAVEGLIVALTGLNELIRAAAGPSVGPALLQGWLSGLQAQASCPADAVVAQVAAQLHQELMA